MINILGSLLQMFETPAKRKKPALRRKAKFHYVPIPATPHPKRGYSEFCMFGRRTEPQTKQRPQIGRNINITA